MSPLRYGPRNEDSGVRSRRESILWWHMAELLTPDILWKIPRVQGPVAAGQRIVVPVTNHDGDESSTTLWLVDGESVRPLTTSTATKPACSPDGSKITFVRPHEGRDQLYLMHLDGGEPRRLTDMPLGVIGAKWHPRGLVVLANVYADHPTLEETLKEKERRDQESLSVHVTENAVYRYWDIWLTDGVVPHIFMLDPATGSLVDLTPESRSWMRWPNTADPLADLAISGDTIAYCADVSEPPHRLIQWALFTIDVDSGRIDRITTSGQAHRPRFASDGSIVYGIQHELDFYADPVRLRIYDPGAGEHRELTEGWDYSASQWEIDDRRVVLVAEERGQQPVWGLALNGESAPVKLADNGTFFGPAILATGEIVAGRSSLESPPEIVRIEADGSWSPVTSFTRDSIQGIDLGHSEEIAVNGGDGEPIQVLLHHPPNSEGSLPLVHLIHGGPHGVFGNDWHWRWNAATFAGAGYLVAMVNFHGSTSFGDSFTRVIQGEWGRLPSADIEAVTDALVAAGLVDPERMAITGGSYGGYLVTWLASSTARYACAVAHAAVTDLPGMYASDVTMGRKRAYGAEIFEDLDRINRWSPSAHMASYETPTLVIAGDKDYRVPVTQGLELYGILKAKGVEARLVHYPDENHWILSKRNSLHWYSEVLRWLDRHLR